MRRESNICITTLVDIVAPLIVILSITNEVNPAMSVVVAPSVKVDEPKVVVGLAKFAFDIAKALPDKFEFVKPPAVNCYCIVSNDCVNTRTTCKC